MVDFLFNGLGVEFTPKSILMQNYQILFCLEILFIVEFTPKSPLHQLLKKGTKSYALQLQNFYPLLFVLPTKIAYFD